MTGNLSLKAGEVRWFSTINMNNYFIISIADFTVKKEL